VRVSDKESVDDIVLEGDEVNVRVRIFVDVQLTVGEGVMRLVDVVVKVNELDIVGVSV
jgi:hypothetical protein